MADTDRASGYSGTPLARKLGLKEGYYTLVVNPPRPYHAFFGELESGLALVVPHLRPTGMVWVSWPKKASGLSSEIGKMDVLRAGQAAGLVDVKVAALDADWSGHKFVIPVHLRGEKESRLLGRG